MEKSEILTDTDIEQLHAAQRTLEVIDLRTRQYARTLERREVGGAWESTVADRAITLGESITKFVEYVQEQVTED